MPIRDITYLKAKFENGDTPTQDDFSDWLETMFYNAPPLSPLVVELRGAMLVDENDPPNNIHFQVDISTSASFATFADRGSTVTSITNWEYWNGISMQGMTVDGLHPAYQNQDVGLVTYTWTGAARGVTYYFRSRAGFNDIWGDYVVGKATA